MSNISNTWSKFSTASFNRPSTKIHRRSQNPLSTSPSPNNTNINLRQGGMKLKNQSPLSQNSPTKSSLLFIPKNRRLSTASIKTKSLFNPNSNRSKKIKSKENNFHLCCPPSNNKYLLKPLTKKTKFHLIF